MDLESALNSLPFAHQTALRLHLAGAGDAAIAVELGMEVDAARSVLKIAHAKLRALLDEGERANAND